MKIAQLCPTLQPQGLYSPWNSPGQNTGVGSLSLLQGIFQFNSWVGKICWRRDSLPTPVFLGVPCGSAGKVSTCNAGDLGFDPWVGKIPWRRERLPTPAFWPEEFHGLSSPWSRKESDTTERLSLSLLRKLCYKWVRIKGHKEK